MKQLTFSQFESEVENSTIPVLVDVYADWCQPCRMLKPVLEKLSNSYGTQVKFFALDAEKETEFVSKFAVSALPTLLMFKSGMLYEKMIGLQSEKALREILDSAI